VACRALSDCSIEIERGSIAGLIGPNGSGKTTLFNMITGYGRVDSGDVYLNDAKITNLAPDKVFALGIGRTFQLTRVFSRLTVMENMIVAAHTRSGPASSGAGGSATRSRGRAAGDPAAGDGAARVHRDRQAGGERAETLSYGQRKLLELSYVLIADRTSSCSTSRPAG
jgi:ABC-type branched-subunit amino acid transport system ATPase component